MPRNDSDSDDDRRSSSTSSSSRSHGSSGSGSSGAKSKPSSSSSSSSSKRSSRDYSDDSDSDDDDRSSSSSSSKRPASSSKSAKSAVAKPTPVSTFVKLDKDQFMKACAEYKRPPALKGGLAHTHKKKPSDFSKVQLYKGYHVEAREHGGVSPNVALAIAQDHLTEIPDYYDRLRDMEAQAKAERK